MFGAGVVFWPIFGLLTVIEDKTGSKWFHTKNEILWLAPAGLCFLCSVLSPAFSSLEIGKKMAVSFGAALTFILMYFLMLWIGMRYFGWLD